MLAVLFVIFAIITLFGDSEKEAPKNIPARKNDHTVAKALGTAVVIGVLEGLGEAIRK